MGRPIPLPDMDFGFGIPALAARLEIEESELRFGFTSREMMEVWFPPALQDFMLDAGDVLRFYMVPEDRVIATKRQAVFPVREAVPGG